jgi:hypothetical protein
MKKILAVIGTTFLVALSGHATVLVNETFSYTNGVLTTVGSANWSHYGGFNLSGFQLDVTNGKARINQGDVSQARQDTSTPLSSTFNPLTDNTSKIYTSFEVTFTALPFNTGGWTNGGYFAHLRTSTAGEEYTRIGASTNGAAAGKFRLAIGNEAPWVSFGSAPPAYLPTDLSLNTTYRVVSLLDLATDKSTLWVDPVLESDPSVTASDSISYAGLINGYVLRQTPSGPIPNGGPGVILLDNLLVGTTFADVVPSVPEPSAIAMAGVGLLILVGYRRRN